MGAYGPHTSISTPSQCPWSRKTHHPCAPSPHPPGRGSVLESCFYAVVVMTLAVCLHYSCSSSQYSFFYQPSLTTVQVASHSSTGQDHILLHSVISHVDFMAKQMVLEVTTQHPYYADYKLNDPCISQQQVVISGGSEAVSPITFSACEAAAAAAQEPLRVTVPLQQSHQAPFDECKAEVHVGIQPGSSNLGMSSGQSSNDGLVVHWSAAWAVQGMNVEIERKYSPVLHILFAAAGVDATWADSSSGLAEQLLQSSSSRQQQEAVITVTLRPQARWKALYMVSRLTQVVAAGWCLFAYLGRFMCGYMLEQLLLRRFNLCVDE